MLVSVGLTGAGLIGQINFLVYGLIAQLVEQAPEERRVVGSIPTQATTLRNPFAPSNGLSFEE